MASLLSLLDTPEPPHMTMQRRAGTRPLSELNAQIDAILKTSEMDRQTAELARGAVLLWHDHFEAAHELAQDVENADGSLLHGILHRREPDYMNARYWFRRVGGNHRSFDCLVGKIKIALLTGRANLLEKQIMPSEKWNPLVFVDFLEDSTRREGNAYDTLLRQIQAAEIHCFIQTLPSGR